MRISDALNGVSRLFIDTAPVIYFVERKNKEAVRQGKVLFVNGAEEMVEGKNQNTLSEANATRLSKTFLAFNDEERFARVVELDEIAKNDFNLNIARYVQTNEEEELIDVAEEVRVLKELMKARDKAEATMLGFLEELGYTKE